MPKMCPQCQTQASDDAAFCPNCGTQSGDPAPSGTAAQPASTLTAPPQRHATVPSAATTGPPERATPSPRGQIAGTGTSVPPYTFRAARWSAADRITGIATLVLFIALFLPWFSAGTLGFSVSESGISAHGYLYVVLLVCIAVVLYLLARAGWDRLPISTRIAHSPVMLVATSLNAGLVVLAFLLKPGGSFVHWSVGAWLALIASIAAAAPTAIPAIQARRDRR